MTDLALIQEDYKIEMEGTVTPPPSISDILFLIEVGATSKAGVTLTAGEARILWNHLEEQS